MLGPGKPANFVFEAHRVCPMNDIPVAHDRLSSPFKEGMSRETVAFLPVHERVGRKQIPEVVVAPKGKWQDMIHIERLTERPAAPDAFRG
jgi:hypothetical protein